MQCDEFVLIAVLNAMIRKNFIITRVSNIELCFSYYLEFLDSKKHIEGLSSLVKKSK